MIRPRSQSSHFSYETLIRCVLGCTRGSTRRTFSTLLTLLSPISAAHTLAGRNLCLFVQKARTLSSTAAPDPCAALLYLTASATLLLRCSACTRKEEWAQHRSACSQTRSRHVRVHTLCASLIARAESAIAFMRTRVALMPNRGGCAGSAPKRLASVTRPLQEQAEARSRLRHLGPQNGPRHQLVFLLQPEHRGGRAAACCNNAAARCSAVETS